MNPIDAWRQRTGRALLLGSVSPSLMTQVAESSAGRLALVVKRPKVYWRDSGLLHALLDVHVPDFEALLAQPWA